MKDYELKISQFVDNELSTNEQQELFRFLAESEEARQTLADYMEMKSEAKSFYAGMNTEMNAQKTLTSGMYIQQKKEKRYRTMFYFSAAAAILLAFLFLFDQFKQDPILTKYKDLQSEMIKLQEDYSALLSKQIELVKVNNRLYTETEKLKTTQATIKNKPVKKVSRSQSHKVNKQQNKKKNNYAPDYPSSALASLLNVQTIEITKNDFLGGQVIGN